MSFSTHDSYSPMIRARHDVTEYIPHVPPSLAVWPVLRTRNVSRNGLVGVNKRCMVCEQFVCSFWTEPCDGRVKWLTKVLAPQPYLRRRLSEDFIERYLRTQ